jgi:hypothetical protein
MNVVRQRQIGRLPLQSLALRAEGSVAVTPAWEVPRDRCCRQHAPVIGGDEPLLRGQNRQAR